MYDICYMIQAYKKNYFQRSNNSASFFVSHSTLTVSLLFIQATNSKQNTKLRNEMENFREFKPE